MNHDMLDTLDAISTKYNLDKNISSGCHNYIPRYTQLFEPIRNNVKNILEIGIGSVENGQMSGVVSQGYKTGNSLKCWKEYFLNAQIFGIDIYEHKELNDDRIKTYVADQNDAKCLFNLMNYINCDLDIIIDDGSHDGEHQAFTFMVLHKFLSKGGIYCIEDIQPQYINNFADLSIFPEKFRCYILNNFKVEFYDSRKLHNRADDVIISFKRI